jgi:hypothetical protein
MAELIDVTTNAIPMPGFGLCCNDLKLKENNRIAKAGKALRGASPASLVNQSCRGKGRFRIVLFGNAQAVMAAVDTNSKRGI